MREVRVQDAVGTVLCHDITEIVRGERKGARFRKGDIIRPEDVPVLLRLGKEHIYVWEDDEDMLHENDAAEVLRELCQNEHMSASAPKEGKIELTATADGVFEINEDAFDAVNEIDDVMIAAIAQHFPVKAGMKIAGMRVIPLVIEKKRCTKVRSTSLMRKANCRTIPIRVGPARTRRTLCQTSSPSSTTVGAPSSPTWTKSLSS